VLGGGLNRIYPEENVPLAGEIALSGAVLSETHPELPVAPQRLVARNRIISGLSRAVIVVEAGQDSGSLIAARRAWEQGRLVYAITGGDIGCDTLIGEGAVALNPEQLDFDALAAAISRISPG
jgi:DNA processing protein